MKTIDYSNPLLLAASIGLVLLSLYLRTLIFHDIPLGLYSKLKQKIGIPSKWNFRVGEYMELFLVYNMG